MSTWNLKLGELEKLREQNEELKRVLMQAFDQAIEHKQIAALFKAEHAHLARRVRALEKQLALARRPRKRR